MEENINIFALVLDELNKNDMWFTTKADPTAEEASSYYKLDEYGEPTEATVKKIEKEVNSLIGDGAVDIYDAVELWVNDALVAFKIDYKDNLVTQFEDKPVVDNIEAYENPVQFPQSKKVEGKQLAYISELQRDTLLKVDEMCNKGMLFTDVWYELQKDGYDLKCYNRNHKRGSDMPTRGMLYKDGEFSFVTIINGRNGKCSWETEGPTYYTEAKTKKIEYYKMPDDEHIIWDSEIDYYDDDYMADVKANQYQDYLNDLGEDETPEDFETWYEDYVEVASYDDNNYLVEDLEENILPEIDKQVNDDFIFMDAYYGSNYPDFRKSQGGGAIFKNGIDGLKKALTQYDRSCVTTKDGVIGVIFDDHDGTHTGTLFTTPDNKVELLKALGYEDIIKKEYDEEDLERYNHNDLMEQEFEEDLYYNNVDVGKVCEYIDLLKPIKDTISGYANKSESKEVKTETYKPTEDEKVGKMKDTNGTFFDVYQHGDKFLDVLGNELSKEEVAEYVKKYNKVESIDNHDYVSIYDEINNLLNVYVSTNEDKLKLYNNFNLDRPLKDLNGDNEDVYYDWLEDFKETNYRELRDYLNELEEDDRLSDWRNKNVFDESKSAERRKKQIEAFKNRKVNFNKRTKDKKFEALEDNFYSAFDSHGFRRKINKDTTIEELMNELYNFITFENISQDDMRKAIRDIVNHINVQFNANLDPERMYLWYINGNYGGTYEKVRKNKITENYQRRLDEVNNKSKNLISDLFSSNDFDSDSPAGQIIMRTSEMFNALSDKGYDVEVTFDNGESTSAIQLGQQGGKVMITITNTDQPLRAFTSGNFEINDQNIKTLQDIQNQIEVL